MSIKFPPAILGPEMAAPILWAPGIFWFFLLENPHAHKIPPFRGGCWGFLGRGGRSANFTFMGVGIFPRLRRQLLKIRRTFWKTPFEAPQTFEKSLGHLFQSNTWPVTCKKVPLACKKAEDPMLTPPPTPELMGTHMRDFLGGPRSRQSIVFLGN